MRYDLSVFEPVARRHVESVETCSFYHSIGFGDGTSVSGEWDIRGLFNEYVGGYRLRGKTVLDVGTATGFLSFEAEKAGAKVTALEGLSAAEYCQIHFSGLPYHEDKVLFDRGTDVWFETIKNGFWYCHNKLKAETEVVYAPLAMLPYWSRKFDVVIAGAILEHLSDPVSTVWNLTRLANEAVIIAFTPVIDSDELMMKTASSWDDPQQSYTWWNLTSALYRRIFANVGFDVEFLTAKAIAKNGVTHKRSTIVARRRQKLSAH